MKLKYVMINHTRPIIFGEYFSHDEFASMGKITSAGFLSIADVPYNKEIHSPTHCGNRYYEVYVYGESVSLKLKSEEDDKYLIEQLLNK
jgi:hypothetical protein